MNPKVTSERLRRKAIVYVRQYSMLQVTHNLESQRRQYGLAAHARDLGFHDIEVIDEDLGRSGSGCVERPGFQRLVTNVCSGEVGGVFCVEASRLARNGRDWHHLIELCALVDTVIIDPEGVYDPRVANDRLLLGLKGTMSEFELDLLRQRSREAIKQKASRGELQFRLAAGLCWIGDRIELELISTYSTHSGWYSRNWKSWAASVKCCYGFVRNSSAFLSGTRMDKLRGGRHATAR